MKKATKKPTGRQSRIKRRIWKGRKARTIKEINDL